MDDLHKLFDQISQLKVGIIGDVMLDTYIWGEVERISPEAPVPVVSIRRNENRVGGAGNVALNVGALGAEAFLISLTGDDAEAEQLRSLLQKNNINTDYCLKSSSRPTTTKTRVIARNQQMMRLDAESTDELEMEEQSALLDAFEKFINKEKPDVVILEDYNKGVLTEAVIKSVISVCRENNILTAVDPKRKNFFEYRHVDLFKPNLKEVKDALNMIHVSPELPVLQAIHAELHQQLEHQVSFITLSEHGVFYQDGQQPAIIPSHLRKIADVSGAGDAVIAVAALVLAASKNVHLMAEVANIAGGLACEQVGAVAVDKSTLMHECELLLS